jgi:putative addiction module component (TIGR02574 family)
MSTLMSSLGIDKLGLDERLQLVEEIWDSIAINPEDAPPLTDAQKQDLQRRIADYKADPKAGSSWEEVKARLQRKL